MLVSTIPDALAQDGYVPLPGGSFDEFPQPQGDTAIEKIWYLILGIARNLRIIIAPLAVIMITISGVQLVVGGANEETVTKQKKSLGLAIAGLALISIAGPISEIVSYDYGPIFGSEADLRNRVRLFDSQVMIIIQFIKYILGALAVLFIVRSGAALIVQGSSDEEIDGAKKGLLAAVIGLVLVLLSNTIVRKIFFVTPDNEAYDNIVQVTLDPGRGVKEIIGITNFIVTFVGPLMVAAVVASAIMMLVGAGNDDLVQKAKKLLLNSVIGVIVIYGAFGIVSTVLIGRF